MVRLLCILIVAFSITLAQSAQTEIVSYLPDPEDLGEWHLMDSVRTFVGEDLFLLIDGGADIYFEYGFQQVVAAEYQKPEGTSIKVELYEMTDAPAAFGIFSLNTGRQGKKIQIGNEGMLYDYYLTFWKERFLVFLTAADTLKETLDGIRMMAASVDRRIPSQGKKPSVIDYLPEEGLSQSRFLRGILGLSSTYIFDTRNIFGTKEAAVGYYTTHTLFIFQYISDKDADESFTNARQELQISKRFSHFHETSGICTTTDQKGSQLCITPFKNLIVIVLAQEENSAVHICDSVITSLRNHP